MIVVKAGTYEPELEGTCPRCGQMERFDLFETDEENNKSCTLCGYFMNITNKPESIDRPSIRDIEALFYQTGGYMPHFAKRLCETFDIRRKK